jgi:transitional endoplasmic reticulum ATPase
VRFDGAVATVVVLCRAWITDATSARFAQVDPFVALHREQLPTDWAGLSVRVDAVASHHVRVASAVHLRVDVDSGRTSVDADELKSILLGKFVAPHFSVSSPRVIVERVVCGDAEADACTETVYRVMASTVLTVDVAPVLAVAARTADASGREQDTAAPGVVSEFVGLRETRTALSELLRMRLEHVDAFRRLGMEPPRGILVRGAPGSGKELLVRSVARECNAKVLFVDSSALLGTYAGESERRLREAFADAEARAASGVSVILVLDRIEAICAIRKSGGGSSNRVVAQILTLLDSASSMQALQSGAVTVVALTSQAERLDPALRRPGRLDREIEIAAPSVADRLEILTAHSRFLQRADNVSLDELARQTVGFVGADLAALCREAAFSALRAARSVVENADFAQALRAVVPTLKRSVAIELDKSVTWSSIAGVGDVKQALREAVEWPILHADAFRAFGIGAPRGILLYGPPGCSKTMLARACANATHCSFISLDGAAIYSPFLGDATLRETFQKARQAVPAIVFLDEVDALVGARSMGSGRDHGDKVQQRVLSTLLNEMDGVSGADGVLVIGATNRADLLDAALMRPGRFDRCLYVAPPDVAGRRAILELYARRSPLAADVDLDALAERTVGFTGADLSSLCREAAMCALRTSGALPVAGAIANAHFAAAMKLVRPSLTPEQVERFSRTL